MSIGGRRKHLAIVVRRAVAAAVVFSLFATGCTGESSDGGNGGPVTAGDTGAVMAAALAELVANDNTFARGEPPFSRYLVQANIDPYAGTAERDPAVDVRPLTAAERSAIESALTRFGPVQWIDDPAEWRTDDLQPKVEGSVILGVGEPVFDADGALVPVSLWCGGLCGTWFTYRLIETEQGWQVTGIEGPRAIS